MTRRRSVPRPDDGGLLPWANPELTYEWSWATNRWERHHRWDNGVVEVSCMEVVDESGRAW